MRTATASLALAVALPFLSACAGAGAGGAPEGAAPAGETEFETRVASALAFDPALLKAGERVVYFVRRAGEPQLVSYSWACTAADDEAVWIENKIPSEPRPVVYKSRISRAGKLLEQHVGEPGGAEPLRLWPRSDAPAGTEALVRRDSSAAAGDSQEAPETLQVGGRSYACTRVTTTLRYPDGRRSTMVNWFSKEVPFASEARLGGLVKRQFGRLNMELAIFDLSGARVELPIPAAAPR
jgi:hypothetical protein